MQTIPYCFGKYTANGWQDAAGETWETFNPACPEEQTGRYTFTSPAELEAVIAAASSAQQAWGALPQIERLAHVSNFVTAIEQRKEEIARAIVLEQGKPLKEALGEVSKSCGEARMMMAFGSQPLGMIMPSARAGWTNSVRYRPLGVVAAITPWNFPVLTPMRKLAPALIFGNAIILKPSEFTPAAACLIASCADDTLPAGVFQLITGDAVIGAQLVSHPQVDGITFTGSVAVGKKIYQQAATHLAKVSLELGGKNAAIIHDYADLQAVIAAVTGAALACSGQRCTSISRVLVQRKHLAAVEAELVKQLSQLVVGNGMTADVSVGPLIHRPHLQKVDEMVRRAISEGARLACGGESTKPGGAEQGFFYLPTLLCDVNSSMEIAREEVFGPVITLQAYDDFDQALAINNSVEYGLTSALFTQDNGLVERFIQGCQSGMIHINHGTVPDNHMPFGGIKASGVGEYSVGPTAFRFYTTEHAVYNRYA
ncbi:aldehyde dehydrogenase [Izhakiella australiensis]|uniref:Aldehyde dehydrogenase n=1 Tax=Izhakiella australiensis TaxID=1926881 RepID=A0A1S8YSL1_9GAMM|nr:aldehyde dehydrogenase family protein [Izhakiella australiensis]OON42074.1 aldehyde dehydrogenase [Izhakiella australiensis]